VNDKCVNDLIEQITKPDKFIIPSKKKTNHKHSLTVAQMTAKTHNISAIEFIVCISEKGRGEWS
jgi:hypothetical protein